MYQKERMDSILEILNTYGYVTVKFLTEKLHYSTATINRDLNALESQKLVQRTYGGVELIKNKGIPLPFRYHKMKSVKAKLGEAASALIKDGDRIFIDGTTTTESIAKFIINKKNITVFTNNVAIVTFLSDLGINVFCLGGKVIEPPYILYSDDTVEAAARHNVDIAFFSTSYISDDGMISAGWYTHLHMIMRKNSKKMYYLVDHEKVGFKGNQNLFDLSHVDGIITDYKFDDEFKEKFKDTEFIEVD